MSPALGPWAEGHRESGGWACPRKYQRAANATIDRVKLSQEGMQQFLGQETSWFKSKLLPLSNQLEYIITVSHFPVEHSERISSLGDPGRRAREQGAGSTGAGAAWTLELRL